MALLPMFGAIGATPAMMLMRGLFLGAMVAIELVEIATAALSNLDGKAAMTFLALNLSAGGAAGFSGGLLGFIFGVPKSLADGSQNAGGLPANASQTNTNLEQISDWLTKILVGAGLTSVASLPGFAAKMVDYLNGHGYQGLPGEGTLAVFIMIYFGTVGFIWGYIETRTTLTRLFNEGDDASVKTDLAQVVRLARSVPGSPPTAGDDEILRLPPASLTTVELLEARGSAEIRADHMSEAIDFLRRAMGMAPSNLQIQRKLAYALSAAHRTDEATRLIDDAKMLAEKAGNTIEQNRLLHNELFNALYVPNGYDKAIEIGTGLLTTDQAANGDLRFWLACAYGQRAAALRQQGADTAAEKAAALEHLGKMKEVRPDLLSLARSVWQPDKYQGNKDENDLEVFHDDPDFAAMLS
jgi:tetratricopeptide (TPR) repeat protein